LFFQRPQGREVQHGDDRHLGHAVTISLVNKAN
jgi:hypothetical protein